MILRESATHTVAALIALIIINSLSKSRVATVRHKAPVSTKTLFLAKITSGDEGKHVGLCKFRWFSVAVT